MELRCSTTDYSGAQSAYAEINNTPQQYSSYQLNSYYSECESGDRPDDCFWVTSPYFYVGSSSGLSVELYFTPSSTVPPQIAYPSPPAGTIYNYTMTSTSGVSGYAPNGNLLNYTDSVNGTWYFGTTGYDSLNRLVSGFATTGSYQGLQITLGYDSFGNRTSDIYGGSSGVSLPTSPTSQYNANNQVTGGSLGYDPAGNVTYDNANQYLYDGEGRICAVYQIPIAGVGGQMTGYLYDAEGRRVAKGTIYSWTCDTTQNSFSLTNTYIIGPTGEQLTETDGSGNWLHTNVFSAGQMLATYSYTDSSHTATDTYFSFTDWLGTKRAVVSAGGCGAGYMSLPYGDSLTATSLPGLSPCPDVTEFHFTGKERDTESGNDYFGARYYSSAMGRWMSPDPSNQGVDFYLPQTWNRYAYSVNNPLVLVDRNGYWVTSIHNEIINESLPGLSSRQLSNLQAASYATDYINQVNGHDPQDPEDSFIHGMSDGVHNQDPMQAQQEGDDFISQNIQDAQIEQAGWEAAGHTGLSPLALTKFGNALHTVTDRISPAHAGNQPWMGTKGLKNKRLAAAHIAKELSIDSSHMDAARIATWALFLRTFGERYFWMAISQPEPKACTSATDSAGNTTGTHCE